MPLLLLKKFWKPLAGILVFVLYSLFVYNSGVDNANTKWELYESERVRVELQQEAQAELEARELFESQREAEAERQREAELAELEAKERVLAAEKEAERLRRKNDATTRELERLQDDDPNGPEPLADGVRIIIHDVQERLRSRRPE